MKREISIRQVYGIQDKVFNVDSKGSKRDFDPVTKMPFIYASPQNVKHCIIDKFVENATDVEKLKRIFTKKANSVIDWIKKGEMDEKQGAVATEIDVRNPLSTISGAWNSVATKNGGDKYAKAALTSAIEISRMAPIHPFLASVYGTTSVCVGDENSTIRIEDSNNVYDNPEDFIEKNNLNKDDKEKIVEYMKSSRPLNFIKANETGSGIYVIDYTIHFDRLMRYNVTENKDLFPQELIDELLQEGWVMSKFGRNEYISAPKEIVKMYYELLAQTLFEWDFETNNSLHGSRKELLRTSITRDDIASWQQATFAEVVDDKKAELVLYDNIDDVYCYNTLLLKKYCTKKDINEPTIDAHKQAIKKLIELGNEVIDSYYEK